MKDKPERVAIAGPGDEDEIYSLLVRMWAHNQGGWGIFFDPRTVIGRIEIGTRPDPETRTDPNDKRCGRIGIIREGGKIVASIGLFVEPVTWFTTLLGMVELWLYVEKGSKDAAGMSRDLFEFGRWEHDRVKEYITRGTTAPFPLSTGFMHRGERFEAMEKMWARRSGGKKVGSLFMVD